MINEDVKAFLKNNKIEYEVVAGEIVIGGSLYLRSLTSIPDGFNPTVGGSLDLSGLKGKKPKSKNLPKNFQADLRKAIELRFEAIGFTIADNIMARIIQERGAVKKIIVCGKIEPSWLASDDMGNHAHGDTIKEALEELAFKTGERDIDTYRNMPLDAIKKPDEWALIYRIITGACKSGVENFMSSKKIKKTYTLDEILAETKGSYGHERFKEVVTGK